MKNFFYTLTFLFVLFSCSDDQENAQTTEPDFAMAAARGLAAGLEMDFDKPIVMTFETDAHAQEIMDNVANEIFEIELLEGIDKNKEFYEEVAVDFLINYDNRTITIIPEPVQRFPGIVQAHADDNEACGGKAGDGWKSYGTCFSENCVKEKSVEAAADLRKQVSSGKCLDVRIKRNTTNARVCARVVSC